MKKRLPKKTEKVLRDMAKDTNCPEKHWVKPEGIKEHVCPPHNHGDSCASCRAYAKLVNPPHTCPLQDEKCPACQYIWEQGEKFGRENHVVKQSAPIVHTVEKEVIVYRKMPTFWVNAFWAMFAGLAWLVGWCMGFGPSWYK